MISISKKIVAVFTTCLFVVILFYNNANKEDGSTKEATEFLQDIISNNNQQTILHQAFKMEMLCSDYKPDPFKPALTNLMKNFGKHECNNLNDLKLKSKGNDLVEVSAYKLNFVDLIGIKMKNDDYELSKKKQVTKPDFPEILLHLGKSYLFIVSRALITLF